MADLHIKIHSIPECAPCEEAFKFYTKLKDDLRGFLDLSVEKIDVMQEIPKEKIPEFVPVIEVEGSCGKKEVVGFGDDAKTAVMEAMKNVLCIGKKAEESEGKA